MCIPTRTHLTYNNDKPWFTAKLRQLRQCSVPEQRVDRRDVQRYTHREPAELPRILLSGRSRQARSENRAAVSIGKQTGYKKLSKNTGNKMGGGGAAHFLFGPVFCHVLPTVMETSERGDVGD